MAFEMPADFVTMKYMSEILFRYLDPLFRPSGVSNTDSS